jgi:hypothetical protein
MASKLKALLDRQKELQTEAQALQCRIDGEVHRNVFDYLNKAAKKHGTELVASVLTGYLNGEEPDAIEEEPDEPKTMGDLLLRLFPDCRTGMERDQFADAYQEFAGNRRWSGLLKAAKVRTRNGKVFRCRN